jgi:hypothetical protein
MSCTSMLWLRKNFILKASLMRQLSWFEAEVLFFDFPS